MATVFGHTVGPTGGDVAIRNGAGYRTGVVTIFPGSSPGSFTRIQPSMSQTAIQAAIDNDTTGKVWWESGTYRGPWGQFDTSVFTLYVKSNQEHRFQTGPNRTASDTAILQGSELVTGWIAGTGADAGLWYVTGQTQNFESRHNNAGPNPYHNDWEPSGHQLEAYYRNGALLIPALAKTAISGRNDCEFFDRAAARVYIGFNPSGQTIEKLSFFGFTFRIRQPGITFKGGIFRHAGFGNITAENQGGSAADNFRIEDAEVSYGRLSNLQFGGQFPETEYLQNTVISHCTLHHGGRFNFGCGKTNNSIVEFTELHHGNDLHFGNRIVGTFDEGCDKTLFTEGFIYRKNWMHDNDGPGAWPDTDCNNFTFEDNVVENNYGAGIHYEQNNVAVIRRNLFNNNQKDGPVGAPFDGSDARWKTIGDWSYKGGGIWISVTANAEIYDNWFYNNKHATMYMRQDFIKDHGRVYNLENMNFHHNRIDHWDSASLQEHMFSYRDSQGIVPPPEPPLWTEASSDEAYSPYMERANNRFNFNEYHVRAAGREDAPTRPFDAWFFAPSGLNKNWAQWRMGFIAQQPTAPAGPLSQGSPASFHDPNSTFSTDLAATPPPWPGTGGGGGGSIPHGPALIGLTANAGVLAEFDAAFTPALTAQRTFAVNGNWLSSDYNETRTINSQGKLVVVSTKLNSQPSEVAAGNHDALITNIAQGLATLSQPPIWIYWHEGENDVINQSVSGKTNYRAAFTRFAQIARANCPGVRIAICYLGSTMAGTATWGPPEDFYPGDSVIDVVMADHYNKRGVSDTGPFWAVPGTNADDVTMTSFFSGANWAAGRGKPFMFGEMGAPREEADTAGVERTAFWKKVADYADANATNIIGYLHYERGDAHGDVDRPNWYIHHEPPSMTQFARLAAMGPVPQGPIVNNLLPVPETDTALAAVVKITQSIGQTSEVDSPLGVGIGVTQPGGIQIITQNAEADSALSASPRTRLEFSGAVTATTFSTASFTFVISTAVETDTATALPGSIIAQVSEVDATKVILVRVRGDWSQPVVATTTIDTSITPVIVSDITNMAASLDDVSKGGDYAPEFSLAGS